MKSIVQILNRLPKFPSLRTRVVVLLLWISLLIVLSFFLNDGQILPNDSGTALIFQGSLLLIILSSLLLEDKFTKPVDAVVNGLSGIISLLPQSFEDRSVLYWIILIYCIVVVITAIVNLGFIHHSKSDQHLLRAISNITYRIASTFGKSDVLFSIIFLYAVFTYYGLGSRESAILVIFWGLYISFRPLKLSLFIEAILFQQRATFPVGAIIRIDSPNFVMVRLFKDHDWTSPLAARLGDGQIKSLLPLYKQIKDSEVVGFGILGDVLDETIYDSRNGYVYERQLADEEIRPKDTIVGIALSGTRITSIKFETWRSDVLAEGKLVFCVVHGKQVFYQIIDANLEEESMGKSKHGYIAVRAIQLGEVKETKFEKVSWLPDINTPVYLASESPELKLDLAENQMVIGNIPFTKIPVLCNVERMISHHTAIVGTTGSGKTEFVFKFIRKVKENKVKIFCVDITGQYKTRIGDGHFMELSVVESDIEELAKCLHNVEIGTYGAPKEKAALREFEDKLRETVANKIEEFLSSDTSIAIFTMPTISNTRTTIRITEYYLSEIFMRARERSDKSSQILVVLEEAHTIIPETSTMGVSDFESKAVVAKIAQIALQGRKYGVGLLIVAQRTANVSKTVLTQCNTLIAFNSFDKTGLEFLSNMFGKFNSSRISKLPYLHVMAYGKGIESDYPVTVQLEKLSK